MIAPTTLATLQRACAPDYAKRWPEYRRPIYVGGPMDYTVWTNTLILLAAPGNPLELPEHQCSATMLEVLHQLRLSITSGPPSQDLTLADLPQPDPCRAHGCTAGRVLRMTCPDCTGAGTFHYGLNIYTCMRCHGNGRISTDDETARGATWQHCSECAGHGATEHAYSHAGSRRAFDARLLRIAAALPGCRFDCAATPRFGTVTADGGIWGAVAGLMP